MQKFGWKLNDLVNIVSNSSAVTDIMPVYISKREKRERYGRSIHFYSDILISY